MLCILPLLTQDACSGERRLEGCPGGVAGGLYLYQRLSRGRSLARVKRQRQGQFF
ncbi:MAG: hypothetical protein RLZZ156_2828 [Deinococcota bacterium]|jgi:hypothetical protein